MKRVALLTGTALLGLSALTACSNGAGAASSTPSASPSASSPSTASPSAGSPAATTGAALSTAKAGKLGTIVVDGKGRTLYVYDVDSKNPPKSNCYGSCAAAWPPLIAGTGMPKLTGISASLVGTVTRTDGSKQVTLAGSPLYYFANDAKAGDVKGQAVGGIWWVVSPSGTKITTKASMSSSSSSSGY
jgi:predicted lipoprotein with Yx(FWY)xxD motif